MGGLFSCFAGQRLPDVYIDFDQVKPTTEAEAEIVNRFHSEIMSKSGPILEQFLNYKDQQALTTAALTKPSAAANQEAMDHVYPNIEFIKELYDFAQNLSKSFITLLEFVMQTIGEGPIEVLDNFPAVTKSFADCFALILQFDEIKLGKPKLLNDVSFFRRAGNTGVMPSSSPSEEEFRALFDYTGQITLFFGGATPLLDLATQSLSTRFSQDEEKRRVIALLGYISDICTVILKKQPFDNPETNLLCLRCIVGSVLIVDRVKDTGAFSRRSPMQIEEAMQVLTSYEPKQVGLINTIKYSSKTLSQPTTIPAVRNLFP